MIVIRHMRDVLFFHLKSVLQTVNDCITLVATMDDDDDKYTHFHDFGLYDGTSIKAFSRELDEDAVEELAHMSQCVVYTVIFPTLVVDSFIGISELYPRPTYPLMHLRPCDTALALVLSLLAHSLGFNTFTR